MTPVWMGLALLAWTAIGLASASVLTRANQRRGVRRVPAIERHVAGTYLCGAVLGPLAPFVLLGVLAGLRQLDRREAARQEREAKRRADVARARAEARKAEGSL